MATRANESMHRPPDHLEAEAFSPLGDHAFVLLDLSRPSAASDAATLSVSTQAIVAGIDFAGTLPPVDAGHFDVLLTASTGAPAPWVPVPQSRLEQRIEAMRAIATAAPIASASLIRVLRTTGALPIGDALVIESFAYSTLLGGGEFRAWLSARPADGRKAPDTGEPFLQIAREDRRVTITLSRPSTRNPICAGMRDALFEALAAALDDPSQPDLQLRGAGACFSTGGDLAEFGTASDLALAHAIRTARSNARLIAELGSRAEAVLHGACIGSGIEIPAAAARRIARPDAFFQLPELRMGLIPGAGGTATIPRAIGRHRAAYLCLSARRIDAATALDWGLVHAIRDGA
ncbi:enoyl-CoA hydratase/isomerase family protein [Sphingomonas sp. G-3-2-10]|uniref:enoyl-CoA hydratase-related protein n=1 Tax=Sphingomonas sp. G-3-2-10 TaxID=2728838 RepID=UPI00146F5F1C|nr:enoyl-CoA hydratase/isomerase family protein [Sphingomonas sp. G-3-2-10]